MKKRARKASNKKMCKMNFNECGKGGGFYFLGFLGSVIYYITTAASFWSGVLGVLKAIVWPAFLYLNCLSTRCLRSSNF